METKTRTFDAVEMSRQLREETSRVLNAMSRDERLTLVSSSLTPAPTYEPSAAFLKDFLALI